MVSTGNSFCIILIVIFFFVRLFTVINFVGVIFVFFLLPETKGKSLEEIEELFAKKTDKNDSLEELPLSNSTL